MAVALSIVLPACSAAIICGMNAKHSAIAMHAIRMAFGVMLCIIVNVIDVYWLALSCTRASHVRREKIGHKGTIFIWNEQIFMIFYTIIVSFSTFFYMFWIL
jgi:hypothetical protein